MLVFRKKFCTNKHLSEVQYMYGQTEALIQLELEWDRFHIKRRVGQGDARLN